MLTRSWFCFFIVLIYRIINGLLKKMYHFLRETTTFMKVYQPPTHPVLYDLSKSRDWLIIMKRQENKYFLFVIQFIYLYYVIELSIIINSIKVIKHINFPSHLKLTQIIALDEHINIEFHFIAMQAHGNVHWK